MTKDAHYPGPTQPTPAWPPLFAAACLALLLAGCGSAPKRAPAAPTVVDVRPADPARANNVLMRAIGLVGTPYRWGGNTPESGFDCSGLVAYVFRDAAGLSLPRTTREQARAPVGRDAPRDRLAPGDLVLFGGRGGVNHVGIYVGEGRFVHAPNEGGTVRLDRLDGHYWRDHYLGARRLLH